MWWVSKIQTHLEELILSTQVQDNSSLIVVTKYVTFIFVNVIFFVQRMNLTKFEDNGATGPHSFPGIPNMLFRTRIRICNAIKEKFCGIYFIYAFLVHELLRSNDLVLSWFDLDLRWSKYSVWYSCFSLPSWFDIIRCIWFSNDSTVQTCTPERSAQLSSL